MSSSARSRRFFPNRFTLPYSVTTQWTSARLVTTPAPGLSIGAMRLMVPCLAVEGMAMIGFPPFERAAARMKSTCPPNPE